VIFRRLRFQIGKEKFLCPLQSLPALVSLNNESSLAFIGYILLVIHVVIVWTGIHPPFLLLHRIAYVTSAEAWF
jgi:hypothetical protein